MFPFTLVAIEKMERISCPSRSLVISFYKAANRLLFYFNYYSIWYNLFVKEFIEHVQKSIYAPEYYRDLLTRPSSYSWKYYASLALFLSVIMTIVSSVPLLPKVHTELARLPEQIVSVYPQDLRIDIKDGHVSTNVTEPYTLPLPVTPSLLASSSLPRQLLVIDTTNEITTEQFSSYNSVFWLSRDALVIADKKEGIRKVLLSNINTTIDRATLRTLLLEIEPYFVFVSPLLVLGIFSALLLSFLIMLVYVLFDAILVFLLGKLLKRNWSYGTSYRICLHAITLPLFITSIFYLLPFPEVQLPFLSTATLLLIVYLNMKETPVVPQSA